MNLLIRITKRLKKMFFSQSLVPVISSESPFGESPRADYETYSSLYREACAKKFPKMDDFEAKHSFPINREWMEVLALHTQVVIKQSQLNFQHGRLLYTVLRDMLEKRKGLDRVAILETGTSRGFSSICMAKALIDSGKYGNIVTIDIIPHNKPIYWNCIDDSEGKKTRAQLLAPWSDELEKVLFLQGDSKIILERLGMSRIHFAFLDACHTEDDVMIEFDYVAARQCQGDVIVFDDVTRGVFDGVVAAVEQVEDSGLYRVERLLVENNRGYAIAVRK